MDVPTIAKINELREDLYGLRKEVKELKEMVEKLLVLASKPITVIEPKKPEIAFPPFSGVGKKGTENAGTRTEENHKKDPIRQGSEKDSKERKSKA